MQLTDKNKVATPENWKVIFYDFRFSIKNVNLMHFQKGDSCMVLPTVKDEEIPTLYPNGVEVINVPSGKKYLRMTQCPQ